MAGMKRFVTYIYSYENREKGSNSGFAKIEIRGEECRMELHLRGVSGNTNATVALFRVADGRMQGFPLGELIVAGGTADFRTMFRAGNLSGSSYSIYDMEGIILFCEDERIFMSRWSEGEPVTVDKEHYKMWEKPAEVRQGEERTAETAESTGARNQDAVVNQSGMGNQGLASVNQPRMGNQGATPVQMRAGEQTTSVNQPRMGNQGFASVNQPGMGNQVATPAQMRAGEQTTSVNQPRMGNQGFASVNQPGMRNQGLASVNQPGMGNQGATPVQMRAEEQTTSVNQPRMGNQGFASVNQPGMGNQVATPVQMRAGEPGSVINQSGMGNQVATPVQMRAGEQTTSVNQSKTGNQGNLAYPGAGEPSAAWGQPRAGEQVTAAGQPRAGEQVAAQPVAGEPAAAVGQPVAGEQVAAQSVAGEPGAAQPGTKSQPNGAALSQEDVAATEIPMRNIFPQYTWEEIWESLKTNHAMYTPFEDEEIACLRIELKDIRNMPKRYWYLGNNSFLLHGFFNYHYLVLGRKGEHYFLGVPGIFQHQERVMATIFGFPEFLPTAFTAGAGESREEEQQNTEPINRFGFWFRYIEE